MKKQALFLLMTLFCSGYSLSVKCNKPLHSGVRFSVNSYRNETGTWMAEVNLQHDGVSREDKQTGKWEFDVNQKVVKCEDTETVNIAITLVSPSPPSGDETAATPEITGNKTPSPQPKTPPQPPPVAEGYDSFPGIGNYRFHKTKLTWDEARKKCESEGAHLAIINSHSEAKVIGKLIKKYSPGDRYTYLGFHDQNEEGHFITVLGEPFSSAGYNVWERNEPNDLNGSENCGSITKDLELNDISCDIKMPFICEQKQ